MTDKERTESNKILLCVLLLPVVVWFLLLSIGLGLQSCLQAGDPPSLPMDYTKDAAGVYKSHTGAIITDSKMLSAISRYETNKLAYDAKKVREWSGDIDGMGLGVLAIFAIVISWVLPVLGFTMYATNS